MSVVVQKVAFHNFNKDARNMIRMNKKCDQIWAVLDDLDGMPRYYAWIDKVYSSSKVDVTWLEFVATDGDLNENAWKRCGLPVACGKFKYGEYQDTIEDMSLFSFKLKLNTKSMAKSYIIHPCEGETWALYKNWNIEWSSDPDNHKEYEYEFVVVLSDWSNKNGVAVDPLVKCKDFACLFKPIKNQRMQIPSDQLLRFSHRVLSHETTGEEQKGVPNYFFEFPKGYFELDPRYLPSNLEEVSIDPKDEYNKKRKHPDAVSTWDKVHKHLQAAEFSGRSLDENKATGVSVCEKNADAYPKEMSPDGLITIPDNVDQEILSSHSLKISEMLDTGFSGRPLDENKATSGSVCEKNADAYPKEMSPDGLIITPGNVDQEILPSPSLKISEMLDTGFCNFDEGRSHRKFKAGQIWAMYCKLDKLPKNYAQIESVESFPDFKVAIKWLESCNPPRGIISWLDKEMPVSCGTFKVMSTEVVVLRDSIAFSHQLSDVPAVDNLYTIHPRAGEVWALYSKFRFDLSCSDLKKCEYDIVEILEVVDVHWIIVSVLQRVTGFKTVFKAKEKEGLDSTAAIPWVELYRFSHQVPTCMLSGARYGTFRGCWELDPRSLAVC